MKRTISEHTMPAGPTSGSPDMPVPIIWVNEFGQTDAQNFFADFLSLNSDDNIKEIFIYIDSFGGSVDSLCTMVELLESTTKPIHTVCLGKAMSAGGILLALGSPGNRWVGPNSRIMLHRISMEFEGDSEYIKTIAKELQRTNDQWLKKIVSRSNITWTEFNNILKENAGEWYLTAKDAVKYGFADRIGIPIIKEIRSLSVEVPNEKTPKPKKKSPAKKAPAKAKTAARKTAKKKRN